MFGIRKSKGLMRRALNKCKYAVPTLIARYILKLANATDKVFVKTYIRYLNSMRVGEKLKYRFLLDMWRYRSHSWIEAEGIYRSECLSSSNSMSLSAVITMEYHRVEKGLTLPNRRVGAGQDAVCRLIQALMKQNSIEGPSFEGAISLRTLSQYFQETPTSALDDKTVDLLHNYELLNKVYKKASFISDDGGYYEIKAEDLMQFSGISQVNFLQNRHSIRDFSQTLVDKDTINEVVRIALKAPSVCNRQAWHLYALTEKSTILKALAFQNGNRGFAERIPLLFVVAVDLRNFVSVEERNQPWIDGGLFSMMLSLALYAKGMGSCMLNWCATHENDQSLRSFLNIPDHQVIIMMMAAGYPPEKVRFTASPRQEMSNVVTFV